jgi:tetratricopeptide (TPR) repeat protein
MEPMHPNTLIINNNMVSVYNLTGDIDLAIKLYHEVLEAQEGVLGSENPDTAITAYNLGALYYENNNLDLAIFYVKVYIKSIYLTRINIRDLDEGLRQSFSKLVEYQYHFLFKLLEEAGRQEEAQEVILLLKLDELEDSLNDDDDDIYLSYTRDNLFKNTPEDPALDRFFLSPEHLQL